MNINFEILISIITGRKLCDDSSWTTLLDAEAYLEKNINFDNNLDDESLREIISNYLLEDYPELQPIIGMIDGVPDENKINFINVIKAKNQYLQKDFVIKPIPATYFNGKTK